MRGEDESTVPGFEDQGAMYDVANGGEGDEDAWEDVEDAVEVDDDLMDELLKYRYVCIPLSSVHSLTATPFRLTANHTVRLETVGRGVTG